MVKNLGQSSAPFMKFYQTVMPQLKCILTPATGLSSITLTTPILTKILEHFSNFCCLRGTVPNLYLSKEMNDNNGFLSLFWKINFADIQRSLEEHMWIVISRGWLRKHSRNNHKMVETLSKVRQHLWKGKQSPHFKQNILLQKRQFCQRIFNWKRWLCFFFHSTHRCWR